MLLSYNSWIITNCTLLVAIKAVNMYANKLLAKLTMISRNKKEKHPIFFNIGITPRPQRAVVYTTTSGLCVCSTAGGRGEHSLSLTSVRATPKN